MYGTVYIFIYMFPNGESSIKKKKKHCMLIKKKKHSARWKENLTYPL